MLFAAIGMAVLAATFFVGCKKEKNEVLTHHEKTETLALTDQISAFQKLRESVNSGMRAEGVMSIEELRQNLDLMANYEHSEHMTCCANIVLDTLYVVMPFVDNDGNVTNMDVVATYEAFETELQKCMEMANDGRDIPSYFSILMSEKAGKTKENITVVFVRGEESKEAKGDRNFLNDDDPFIEGVDNWIWGENLGLCKWYPYNASTDAAGRLSEQFLYEVPAEHQGDICVITNVVHVNYRPCSHIIPGISSQEYVDPYMEDCADTWLFFQPTVNPEDCCVKWSEMNCFWRSINRNIVDTLAPWHFVLHPDYSNRYVPYHTCSIHWSRFFNTDIGTPYCNYYYQVHYAHVVYCDISWMGPSPD